LTKSILVDDDTTLAAALRLSYIQVTGVLALVTATLVAATGVAVAVAVAGETAGEVEVEGVADELSDGYVFCESVSNLTNPFRNLGSHGCAYKPRIALERSLNRLYLYPCINKISDAYYNLVKFEALNGTRYARVTCEHKLVDLYIQFDLHQGRMKHEAKKI
jgi:hypothetical protein